MYCPFSADTGIAEGINYLAIGTVQFVLFEAIALK